MYYDYSYGYETSQMSSGALVSIILFSLLLSAFLIVTYWIIYKKAGEEGWESIVPLYNGYILFKFTWGNGWLFLLWLIPFVNIVIGIMTMIKLAQVFGKGGGFACGLIFLPIIFLPIMAFNKDIVYVGIPGQTPAYGAGYGQPGYQQPNYQNPYSQGYQAPNNQQTGYQAPPQQNNYQQQSAQNSQYYYQQPTAQSSPKYCAGCGTQLANNEKFCPKCGKPQ